MQLYADMALGRALLWASTIPCTPDPEGQCHRGSSPPWGPGCPTHLHSPSPQQGWQSWDPFPTEGSCRAELGPLSAWREHQDRGGSGPHSVMEAAVTTAPSPAPLLPAAAQPPGMGSRARLERLFVLTALKLH